MRQHGRWSLISANRVNEINCFTRVTVGTRTKGLLNAHLSDAACSRDIYIFFYNNTVSASNNGCDNTEKPW